MERARLRWGWVDLVFLSRSLHFFFTIANIIGVNVATKWIRVIEEGFFYSFGGGFEGIF